MTNPQGEIARLDLDALERLLGEATPGPWRCADITMAGERYVVGDGAVIATRAKPSEAALIAAARLSALPPEPPVESGEEER